MQDKTLLIFGFGYTAGVLCGLASKAGFKIIGTSRQAHAVSNASIIAFNETAVAEYLPAVTHVLVSTPPMNTGCPVLEQFSDSLARHAVALQWIGYLSSTGVYGDHQGQGVDEQSACRPVGLHAQQRLLAEQAWSRFAGRLARALTIFRIAGIYGPGRNPLLRLLAGQLTSIDKPGQVFSRIHVLDLAESILSALLQPELAGIYNVADDEPASACEVDAYAAHLLARPAPRIIAYDSAELSARLKEFYQANRRVSNVKLKRELWPQLMFPSYREGLTHLCVTLEKKTTFR